MLAEADELTFEADRLKIEADTTVSLEDGKATAAIAAIEVASSNASSPASRSASPWAGRADREGSARGLVLKLVAKQGTEMVKAATRSRSWSPTLRSAPSSSGSTVATRR